MIALHSSIALTCLAQEILEYDLPGNQLSQQAATAVPPVAPANSTLLIGEIGGTAGFSTVVTGSGPFSYHWQLNGNTIPGVTGASLFLSNLTTDQAGSYTVIIRNSYGTQT